MQSTKPEGLGYARSWWRPFALLLLLGLAACAAYQGAKGPEALPPKGVAVPEALPGSAELPPPTSSPKPPGGDAARLPAFSPWPPPAASARVTLESLLRDDPALRSLGDLNRKLVRGLKQVGYVERAYFSVPGGFAIATRLERIDDDGRPVKGKARWVDSIAPIDLSLSEILKRLFGAPPGFFRITVFVVTGEGYVMDGQAVKQATAEAWLSSGADRLPSEFDRVAITRDTQCTALVYEFERRPADPEARQIKRLDARIHLDAAGLSAALPITW